VNARLIEIREERKALFLRIIALDQEENEILSEDVRTECPDFSDYSPNTRNLLEAIWDAPGRMLSKAEIGEAVMGDDMAGDEYIRQVKKRANEEMEKRGFPFCLKQVRGEGYKLVTNASQT
jgi:DNA-binding response OmpR family regulator